MKTKSKPLVVWVPIRTDRDGSISGGPYVAFTRKEALIDARENGYREMRVVKFVEAPKRRKR